MVEVAAYSHPLRWLAVEWIGGEQRTSSLVAVEKFPREVDEPRIFLGEPFVHRREPDQPIEAAVIGAEHTWAACDVARLARQLVCTPVRRARILVERAFD